MRSRDREILKPLVEETAELAAEPRMEARKRMWADHQALRRTEKIPVCVWFEYIPEPQWEAMLGPGYLQSAAPLARLIEGELRKRCWMARNVPDDHIVWPSVTVPAVLRREVGWGVDFHMSGAGGADDDPLQARRMVPAFPEAIQVERLAFSDLEVDGEATGRAREEALELVDGRLAVQVSYPDLGHSPFDLAVRMRGLEAFMYDVVDAPELVEALMEAITGAFQRHHSNRERRGWLNVHPSADGRYHRVGFRVHCAYPAPDAAAGQPRLCDEWAYVSAQTAAGLGPEMFARFVQPFNARLAAAFTNETVYYHGCECLDRKLDSLATLPHLRRFHVSPWSSVARAAEKLRGSVVLEVHAHPGRVLFGASRSEMKAELAALLSQAGGAPLDLNLSDIHSVNGNPATLAVWAGAAQELAGG